MTEHLCGYCESNQTYGAWPALGERVIDSPVYRKPVEPDRPLSALQAIEELTRVTSADKIGQNGPSGAATTTAESKDDPELNLYGSQDSEIVFFPRDGHVVASFLRETYPQLVSATIHYALRFTGVRDNLRHSSQLSDGQEVGKVPHEVRRPEDVIAKKQSELKDWGWPFFGAMDTTGKNVLAISQIALSTEGPGLAFLQETYDGLDGKRHSIEDGLAGHINWIRRKMNQNTEGLVEMLHLNPKHHANESWEDSPDAFFHADGSWARHDADKNWGVAPLELQVETYDALLAAAKLYKKLSLEADGQRRDFLLTEVQDLTSRASRLREVIMKKFWVEDPAHAGGFFARGTDRDEHGKLRPLAVRSSDMGFMLDSAILEGEDADTLRKREAVIRNLFSPEMLCASGIRTLASDSARYGEERWHNGASWPWVTYKIARGLKRHAYYGLAYELEYRAWTSYAATHLLSEYFSGTNDPSRLSVTHTVRIADPSIPSEPERPIGQPSQEIQAWTAAAMLAMKREEGKRLRVLGGAALGVKTERIPIVAQDAARRQLERELVPHPLRPRPTKKGNIRNSGMRVPIAA